MVGRLAFYTVTNRRYFPGTVATLSSIRAFHPEATIFVFAEIREELTREQQAHLSALPGVILRQARELVHGAVREAWQMKAHGAKAIAEEFQGVLVHVDSDAVLVSALDDIAADVAESGRPAGGKDGSGERYTAETHHPYVSLCGAGGDGSGVNQNYISTSILLLPLPSLAEVVTLWSAAVDEACFGPQSADKRRFPGHGDQGVFNAILYFRSIEPLVLENSSLSEHWVHGAENVTLSDGRFRKGETWQRAFHSVGDVPKFWKPDYAKLVEANGNLREVYLYWLYQLFDGPCGFLTWGSMDDWRANAEAFAPCFGAGLLETYCKERQPQLRRVITEFGRFRHSEITPRQFPKSSDNVMCCLAFDGYLDDRGDVHYLYSAIARLKNYRLLGGKADLVIFVNANCLRDHATHVLLESAERNGISIVESSSDELRHLFMRKGIDIECMRLGCIGGLEQGKRKGHFHPSVNERYGVLVAMEVFLGRLLLVADWAEKLGYTRSALIDADGGRYDFSPADVPANCHVDDIWEFDRFTDLIYQETSTGKEDLHGVTNSGVRLMFNLRAEENIMPMFQTNGHWIQGTTPAFRRYVDLAMEEAKRLYLLGFYPDDELATTSVILRSLLWPEFGSMAGHSLRRQIELINGTGEHWYRPFYAERGEEKYTRRFLAPPSVRRKCAICIAGFDGPAELRSRKYSLAAADRVNAYRHVLKGTADVHMFTDNHELLGFDGAEVHLCTAEELTRQWDPRATFEFILALHDDACADAARHKGGHFLKNPQYACGMIAKLVAVEEVFRLGYDTVLSADADGMQFSRDTIGALGRMHIDGIWAAAEHHPFIGYVVGTGENDSFNVWLSVLRSISGLPASNDGPVDWIWGPCWMMNRDFSERFMPLARKVYERFNDLRVVCYDEHILNCTYNLCQFDQNPFRGIRDLGDAALVGYREMNPDCFLRYKRWSGKEKHEGRKGRPHLWYYEPEFEYAI